MDDGEAIRVRFAIERNVSPEVVGVVRSPHRICPLGAHVDHQGGPVLAAAVDMAVHLAFIAAPVECPDRVELHSNAFADPVRFSLPDIPDAIPSDWGNFPRGAAQVLRHKYGVRHGLVGRIHGGRIGEGLSSSAAVSIAYLLALSHVNGLVLDEAQLIELGRQVENEYLGLRSGILDQSAIVLSRQGCLTHINCLTSSHGWIETPPEMPAHRFVVVPSGIRQPLVGTDYNKRVGECEEAAKFLLARESRADLPPLLGHVSRACFDVHEAELPPGPRKRARHFFTESERVRLGIEAWRTGDIARFGSLMTASCSSSIENYECGSPPLIALHQALIGTEGVLGSRFSGAGFRGCCVALIDLAHENRIRHMLNRHFESHSDRQEILAGFRTVDLADGAWLDPSRFDRILPR